MTQAIPFVPTADLADAFTSEITLIRLPFRDFGAKRRYAGRARTLATLDDTKLLVDALYSTPGDGAVAVVDGAGSTRSALLGDVNAARLRDNGWSGIVINGAVRDIAALASLDLGIKALDAVPMRSNKTGCGAFDILLAFGQALIAPGDCIYCDEDGVVVSKNPLMPAGMGG